MQGNVHLVAGSGANITVQVDPDGLLVVDTSVAAMSEKVLAAIKTISDKPIRHIINTSADEHHTGGNESLSNAGRNINAGTGGQSGREPARLDGAPVIAHEQVLHRMSGLKGEPARMPYGVWPHDTFYTNRKQLYFGGEVVEMLHVPAAHTDGDVIVWFRKSDVVATGDVFSTVTYPMIDRARGGSIQGAAGRAQPHPRHHRSRVQQPGRHAGDPRARTHLQRVRRRRIPRHDDDHPRPHQAHGRQGHDPGAGEGRRADERLRRRVLDAGVDRRDVHRGDLRRPDARSDAVIMSVMLIFITLTRRSLRHPPALLGMDPRRRRSAADLSHVGLMSTARPGNDPVTESDGESVSHGATAPRRRTERATPVTRCARLWSSGTLAHKPLGINVQLVRTACHSTNMPGRRPGTGAAP